MAKMGSRSRQLELIQDLKIADTMWTRMKGLLGTKKLSYEQSMWIHRCNSIHTFFMKFPIDCVFVDQHLKVVSIVENVVPGRIVFPQFKADSVFEMNAGEANRKGIYKGEELYVDC